MLQLAQRQRVHLADVQAQLLTSALQRVMAIDPTVTICKQAYSVPQSVLFSASKIHTLARRSPACDHTAAGQAVVLRLPKAGPEGALKR